MDFSFEKNCQNFLFPLSFLIFLFLSFLSTPSSLLHGLHLDYPKYYINAEWDLLLGVGSSLPCL